MRGGGDRRRARPGARRLGGADAALPDANPHAVRRFDHRKLDVGAIGKRRMVFERRTQPRKPLVVGQRAQHDALRVADGQHRRRQRSRPARRAGARRCRWAAPSRRQTGTTRPTRPRAPAAWTRPSSRRRRLAIVSRPVRRQSRATMRRQASQPVAGQLRRAAVGVEQLHRRALRRERVENQPVGADAAMAVAEPAAPTPPDRQPRQLGGGHVQEVVAVGVRLGERDHVDDLRQNASRCQP